ncbi:multiple coagulation factor deficiency protein 2 like protein [Plakobranchus ocellatus]|uniref:Multiple coagulation factor deficiency protein 2 like protein n=1 Tax=Plakobranchus ocellatus TaxID=259542 RepID=A0AAV3ZWS2_9GAST|nr:multiple coagulation factor deficiency protein 2 like protein [Plakobranchus ocellatus]
MQVLVASAVLCLSFVSLSFQQPPGVPPHNQQQHQAGGHGHSQQQGGQGHGHEQGLHFSSEVHNADHILEHLQNVVATKKKEDMTEEELEFHYFKLHDYDNNNKLDGVEIGKALTHFHEEGQREPNHAGQQSSESADHQGDKQKTEALVIDDRHLTISIDSALATYDRNKDGYIEYFEFKIGKHDVKKSQ